MSEIHFTAFITLSCTSAVLSLFLCLYAYLKRNEIQGARIFILYSAALTIYIFGSTFELASQSMAAKKFWIAVEYIGLPFAPVLGLLLVLHYIGRRVGKVVVILMLIIPLTTFTMVVTNDWHHLFYRSIFLNDAYPIPLSQVTIGQWYIVHGIYTFASLLASTILLARQWRRTKKTYRPQLATLIVGQIVPMLAAFIYLMGLTPGGMDPVPIVLCVTSATYIWAMVTTRMLTIIPIAKDILFESMQEGVIVLDASKRLIDYNAAAGLMLPGLSSALLGQRLDELWQQLTGAEFPVTVDRQSHNKQGEWSWSDGNLKLDYQFRISELRDRAGFYIGSLLMFINISEQKRLQRQLEQLAYYDGLTKIFNRMQFITQSKELLQRARLLKQPFCLILFDVDYFKQVNDTYGHEAGDRALKHVVHVSKQLLHADMLFGRYGGEEFAIALPNTALEEAYAAAEQLRARLHAEAIQLDSQLFHVTASFGVASLISEADTLESLLRDADAALYEAKGAGRNRVIASSPERGGSKTPFQA